MLKRRSSYTIRDIARMAGVSRSTVSLALNDSPRINDDTKKRVLALIQEVGYRPNHAARNLASRTSKTILVILPEVDQAFSDGYFSESLSGILDAGAFHEYHLMVQAATEAFKRENRPLKLFRQHTIDAVLCLGNVDGDTYLQEVANAGCPLMLVNSQMGELPAVTGAVEEIAFKAIEHLHSLGHTRIAHITGNHQLWASAQRTAGYKRAINELGLDSQSSLVARGNCSVNAGFEAMKQLLALDKIPTAVFCANDMNAVGAVQAIQQAGLTVPHGIAVFGGDDAHPARYVSPQLSTIQPAMYSIGETACESLVRFLEGTSPELASSQLPLTLSIRQSCGARLPATKRTGESYTELAAAI
jgi:DNA-binding LacI/PurR family transcriptional regulator